MLRKIFLILLLILPTLLVSNVAAQEEDETNDAAIVASLNAVNVELAARGLSIRATELHAFVIPGARQASGRILQQAFRWVPGDPNRLPDGTDLTYMIVPDATDDGVTAAQTTNALRAALETWDADSCANGLNLNERAWTGEDVTIYDSFFGFGGFGNYLAADIVNAGWYPKAFFDAATGGRGNNVLAFSVTFTWTDDAGNPLDANNDGYVDTALNEVYFNDHFRWGIDAVLVPGNATFDVQTVGLHENGHSLGLGHFAPPPDAVMNPIYAGIRQNILGTDHGAFCTVFAQWPRR